MLPKLEKILLFLVIFLLPTQLGKHFWPNFSFIYSLPVDYLSPTIYLWDILSLLLFVVFLLQSKHINRTAINLFYLFLLTQSVSLIFSQNMGVGFIRLEQYLFAGLFGVYMASVNFKKIKPLLFSALGLAVLFQSILATLQFIKEGTLGLWILGERSFSILTPGIAKSDFYGLEYLRPYGTFPHPNVLAGFMLVTLPLLSNKWLTLLGAVPAILTVSRVALIAGLLESYWMVSKKWKKFLLIAFLILSPVIFIRFHALFFYDNLTFLRREDLTISAINLFLHSPLFGIGLNNFIPADSSGIVSGPSRFLQPVHNIFLLALSETGIVGLLGFLGLIVIPIRKIWGNRQFMIIWGTILFLGLFDHYFLTLPQGYRLLFLIWGLSFSMLEFKNGKSSEDI